jgi:diguanylate cyclase
MNIQSIIKNSIKRLELENKLQTPDSYSEAFCKEAKKAGFKVEDCSHVEKFTASLNKEFQEELKKYNIKNMSELSRFLISKLNRTNPSHCSNLLEAQNSFTKKIIQTIEVLHNKEAGELAKKSLELISSDYTIAELEQFKGAWSNFLLTYDDSFLEKLKTFGQIDSTNLKSSIENLKFEIAKTDNKECLKLEHVASSLIASLVPSISSKIDTKIIEFSKKIKNNPSLLEDKDIDMQIKSIISLRIALDKQSVKEMIESIDGVLDKLSIRLIEMIESSDNSTVEIQKIKNELEKYNESSNQNFTLTHKKLYTIATALEESTTTLNQNLKKHSNEVTVLSKKIEKLEDELKKAREDSKEDFLTKVYNKRALEEFLNIKESEFKRHGHNFSVVFFDLDHFKAVNDTYGHDAGDAVLVAFAKILKSEARDEDTIGRFGGEEFVAILSTADSDGAVVFAQKVREKVKRARMMYKDSRIALTVSSGVSDRASNTSLTSLIKTADEYMYKAKKDGRDRVVSK